jgi:L-asparaginase II
VANPFLVELTRGALVESAHRGAVAISDAHGKLVFALGDVALPVYPRSALKPIQALPLLESGAAEAFHVSDEEIALACASHSGEPMHTQRVAAWLARIGLGEQDLACGTHPVRYEPVAEEMIRHGEKPSRIHNNCSGKHTGFLAVARHWDIATAGYERHDHPVQQAVEKATCELAAITQELPWGVDGCAAPNFALPLANFARALAQFANPENLAPKRRRAVERIRAAMIAHPELVAGTGRICTTLMRAGAGRVAVKTGAEGVFAAIAPEAGLGIALKIDDGGGRAAETAIAFLLDRLGLVGGDAMHDLIYAPIRNTRDVVTGERRPAPALTQASLTRLQ